MSQPLAISFILEGQERPVVFYERWGAYTLTALQYAEECLQHWKALSPSWGQLEGVLNHKLSPDERIQLMLMTIGGVVCVEDEEVDTPLMPLLRHDISPSFGGCFTTRESTAERYSNGVCGSITVNLDDLTTELDICEMNACDAYDSYFDDEEDGDPHEWYESLPKVELDPWNVRIEDIPRWKNIVSTHQFFCSPHCDDTYGVFIVEE